VSSSGWLGAKLSRLIERRLQVQVRDRAALVDEDPVEVGLVDEPASFTGRYSLHAPVN